MWPASSAKIAQVDDLLREQVGVRLGVALAHAEQHEQAGPDAGTTRPATVTDASRTRCTTALIRPSACGAWLLLNGLGR